MHLQYLLAAKLRKGDDVVMSCSVLVFVGHAHTYKVQFAVKIENCQSLSQPLSIGPCAVSFLLIGTEGLTRCRYVCRGIRGVEDMSETHTVR